MQQRTITVDGNEAVAQVAYRLAEVIAIYPITPASPMGEWADQWAANGKPNLWDQVPRVVEMQSEGGAAGVVHGALQGGALTTTFTASQGLLLMMPNMFKIAGELTPAVIHVAARSIATQALSIFGDHSDVMAVRACGWAMLCSASVQEAQDMACIAHGVTLKARLPFLHFFDGFRTSHEIAKIIPLETATLEAMMAAKDIESHRHRSLSPDHPFIRGTAQNPDVFFQARETVNSYYLATPELVQQAMDHFAELTGRTYHLFDYCGHPKADRVIVMMGSGAETAETTVNHLVEQGERVGLLRVRLYRPFSVEHFLAALPPSVTSVAVLDRTKEPGATGEPLYQDVVTALAERTEGPRPRVVGGRYGLSSKEFTPAMVKTIFTSLASDKPKNHFTIGIHDDVTHTSLPWDPRFHIEDPATIRAVFFGLGSDGTVGANKNAIKIIGEQTTGHAQGYFVYDSKKSGAATVSHLRFGAKPIRAPYLIQEASFVACHQFGFLSKMDITGIAGKGATLLLNCPHPPERVWENLPQQVRQAIRTKDLALYAIDAYQVARDCGLGGRINTIMQTCFFALSEVLPKEQALAEIKKAVTTTYGKRGAVVVNKNHAAIDQALSHLRRITIPPLAETPPEETTADKPVAHQIPALTARLIAGEGETLPVSALPHDGTFPSGTTRFEKRCIAQEIPVWDEDLCIQCGKCVLVCPHAVIRGKLTDQQHLQQAPEGFASAPARWRGHKDLSYTLQVAPEDCTGCGLCVAVCPAKNRRQPKLRAINMEPLDQHLEQARDHWSFFLDLPDIDRSQFNMNHVKDVQLITPLFEFSGACAGCGETPYLKLLSQLFGDHAVVANATGCSSIYGGNLPTTPWTVDKHGRGPAWSNSLFEDNAEFGLGIRLALDERHRLARQLLPQFAPVVGEDLVDALLGNTQQEDRDLDAQRHMIATLKTKLANNNEAQEFLALADDLARKSVWIVGGDGWAYDIGFGGLDHVLASGANVNLLILDTEVYSNTGGQMSKATPRAAVAKFAAGGKRGAKKDLALMAMNYGHVYVANVAMGGDDAHTLKVFREAEAYEGPSLIIAYSHCIAHGYDLVHGMAQQKAAVQSGHWPLFRFHPDRLEQGETGLVLDSKPPSIPLRHYLYNETRYTMLAHGQPEVAQSLLQQAQSDVKARWQRLTRLAQGENLEAKEETRS